MLFAILMALLNIRLGIWIPNPVRYGKRPHAPAPNHFKHGANGIAVTCWLFAFRDLEEGQKAIVTHIEEVMAHLLVRWVAAVAGPSAKTGWHPHRMDERHAEHFDVEVDCRLHVVSAQREVVDAPRCR
jgi:hypothetical protein